MIDRRRGEQKQRKESPKNIREQRLDEKMSESYETVVLNLKGNVNPPAVKEEHWIIASYFHCRRH